jgi:protein transport protein SEC61 subunit gamma-like protein
MVGMSDAEAASKAQDIQDDLESKMGNLGKGKYGRILQMAHTPDKEEYLKTAKISAIGIILLGALGFLIMWLMTYLPDYF